MSVAGPLILGSVRSVAEAQVLLAHDVDIIDLKEPRRGALGAVPQARAQAIMSVVAGRARSSATIGDVAVDSGSLRARIERTAALGVDYVKVGLFGAEVPGSGFLGTLQALGTQGVAIVLVLFADRSPRPEYWHCLADSGVRGVLLDTSDKSTGTLPELVDAGFLRRFLSVFHSAGLLVGFAGSLGVEHLDREVLFEADYLGFRAALCRGAARHAPVDGEQVAALCARVRAGARRVAPRKFIELRRQSNDSVA